MVFLLQHVATIDVAFMGKVEDLNLQQDIIELHSRGESARSIAKIFHKQGISINHSTISIWIKTHGHLFEDMLRHNVEIKKRTIAHFLDASQQLLFMNKQAKSIYEQATQEGDRLNALRALDQMGKNLVLYQKFIGLPEKDKPPVLQVIEQLPTEYREVLIDIYNKRSE